MISVRALTLSLALGSLMGLASAGQAQQLFSYTSVVTPLTMTNNGITIGADPTTSSASSQDAGDLGTSVRAGGFRVISGGSGLATFHGMYIDTFTLTDSLSGDSHAFTFGVNLAVMASQMQVTPGTTAISLTPAVQSVTLGSASTGFRTYFVRLANFDNVATNGAAQYGSFSFQVQATNPINATPEPGAMALLIGMSMTGAGFLARRKRVRIRKAA